MAITMDAYIRTKVTLRFPAIVNPLFPVRYGSPIRLSRNRRDLDSGIIPLFSHTLAGISQMIRFASIQYMYHARFGITHAAFHDPRFAQSDHSRFAARPCISRIPEELKRIHPFFPLLSDVKFRKIRQFAPLSRIFGKNRGVMGKKDIFPFTFARLYVTFFTGIADVFQKRRMSAR